MPDTFTLKQLFEKIEKDADVELVDVALTDFIVWFPPEEAWELAIEQDIQQAGTLNHKAVALKKAPRLTLQAARPWPMNTDTKILFMFENEDEYRVYTIYARDEGQAALPPDKIPPPRCHTLSKHAGCYSSKKFAKYEVFIAEVVEELRALAELEEHAEAIEAGRAMELEEVVEFIKKTKPLGGGPVDLDLLIKHLEDEKHHEEDEAAEAAE